MGGTELEERPGPQALMLKEWLELESSAELSRDGFGCYPRHLAAELRNASGRRRNGDVIARFSAAVRAALALPRAPAGREGEAAAALPRTRSLSRRLRVGFWKKRRGEAEETDRPVGSCSATAARSGRNAPPSPAMSPRRMSWEGRQARGDGAGHLSGGRRSHEKMVAGCECETTCRLDEAREREQRLSPVSVMDFLSQDGDDGHDDDCNDRGGSPTFERSLASIRRASQQLLQRVRRFEQLEELDTSDVDDAATTAEDTASSCHVEELDPTEEDDEVGHAQEQDPTEDDEAGSPRAAHCFKKLLKDFFREGLSSSPCHDGRPDDPEEVERSLLETARAWVDGRHRAPVPDGKAEVEEIERLGRWRRFGEEGRELLGCDVEGGIFWSLVEELVDDLC
ncbi:hypothetical protein GQ55_7G251800 [Panicum hallii var. hallii]|uniref:DUF4378 domain-containing protein n=1 Tax=Panicum hallii var. hallii TaxID=1504633 RepID=A0A2T7CYW4_9POAL|nr:hypothetical protein GQ55_7G251800 [Panicum hallii var. hallii]